MDRSQLVCAQCQWKWPLQSRPGFFEGQSLESVACPQCQALALQVVASQQRFKRFQPPRVAKPAIRHAPARDAKS